MPSLMEICIKTSKHINLGLAMKSNSRKMINILNKYGHCCSYTTLEELETEATFAATSRLNICPEGKNKQFVHGISIQ
jgi:hypothetical protein